MKHGGDREETLISCLENSEWQGLDGSESRQKMKWWHGQLSHLHRQTVWPTNQSLSEEAASHWVSLGRQQAHTHNQRTLSKSVLKSFSRPFKLSPALCYWPFVSCFASYQHSDAFYMFHIYLYLLQEHNSHTWFKRVLPTGNRKWNIAEQTIRWKSHNTDRLINWLIDGTFCLSHSSQESYTKSITYMYSMSVYCDCILKYLLLMPSGETVK